MPTERGNPTRVLLGVTGGIAAYKAPELVRRLVERGCEVQVVMTDGARRFVTPLTFEAVSGRRVREDLWRAPSVITTWTSQPRSTSRRTSSGALYAAIPAVHAKQHSRRIASFGRHRGSLQGDELHSECGRPLANRLFLMSSRIDRAPQHEDGGFFTRRSARV